MKKSNYFWHTLRIIGFLVIGLMNTALIKSIDIGSWKNYVCYAFLLFALVEIAFLIRKYIRTKEMKHVHEK